ncbi:unnamed protein product [Lymnaea stagnalis]|uniref:RING-type E3 ubiquitin transferase n=1 Tax=Lymnaea stagnalis TaxID=6523 RepID=A0AAV2ICQ1_LYMST
MDEVIFNRKPGLRVVRGPDWEGQDEDCCEGHVGTVLETGGQFGCKTPDKYVTVIWDSGFKGCYRAGHKGAYDLRVLDNNQCGVFHLSTKCSGCQDRDIKGFRWKCAICPSVDLCTACYMSDKHDSIHVFTRYDTPESDGVRVPPRCNSENDKQLAMGIFKDALVTRGPDWGWQNQDGGAGQTGKVVNIIKWDRNYIGEVKVRWKSGSEWSYRLGPDGKVDLKCVVASTGGYYYKSHLPVVGKMKNDTNETPEAVTENYRQILRRSALSAELTSCDPSRFGVGYRVVRGPDWNCGNQDGGEGFVGTIAETLGQGFGKPPINFVNVIWDTGSMGVYRAGHEDKFDLRVFDIGVDGTKHESVMCDSCMMEDIRGIRWKCSQCKNANLCSQCYSDDRHDISHQFLRYDSPDPKKIFKVRKRCESQKVQVMGIFPGATVSRVREGKCDDDYAGNGNVGRVVSIADSGKSSFRTAVTVQWPSGSQMTIHSGHNGNIELKCVKAAPGGFYYRNHMPIFGKEPPPCAAQRERFKVGDQVKIAVDISQLKRLQQGHGGLPDNMNQHLDSVGKVSRINEEDDVVVKFGDSGPYTFNPAGLTKVKLKFPNDPFAPSNPKDGCSSRKMAKTSSHSNSSRGSSEMSTPRYQPQCKICLEQDACITFIPCGHFASCRYCASRLTNCAICRREITERQLTFIP